MDIKELTEKYRKRFEAFYHTEGSNTDRKGAGGRERKKVRAFKKRSYARYLTRYRNCYRDMALSKPRVITLCTENIVVLKQALSLLVDFL